MNYIKNNSGNYQWIGWFISSLWDNLEWNKESKKIYILEKYIGFFEDIIGKYENFWLEPNNINEQNIINWYKNNWNTYSSKEYKSDKKFKKYRKIVNTIKNNEHYIFKTIVERIWKQLIDSLLQKELEKNNKSNNWISINTLLSSDNDDVYWKIDLILLYSNFWNESYLWIDIAVSEDDFYLSKKTEISDTKCREFNMFKNLNIDTKIKRVVLNFDKKVMANFLLEVFRQIEDNWKIDDIVDIYFKNYKKFSSDSEYIWLSVENVQNWIKNWIDKILTIRQ